MNSIFVFFFILFLIISLLLDYKKLKSNKRSVKVIYIGILGATLILMISKYMQHTIPLPSRFFIHTVSPWVSRVIGL
jgi:uncharacterized membrane protein